MVYMASFHAISRSLAPVPKVERPTDEYDTDSGYNTRSHSNGSVHNEIPYYNTGGHWSTSPDSASVYGHGSVSAPSLPSTPPYYGPGSSATGQIDYEAPPALPPRRTPSQHVVCDQPGFSQTESSPLDTKPDHKDPNAWYQKDYAPPPGPPPAHLIGLAPTPSLPDYQDDDIRKPEVLPALPQRPKTITGTLSKPIAIPSVNTELGSPYMRAYPTCLYHFGIPRDTFLRFLDRLNRVSSANPPLTMLGIGAGLAGFVPEPTTAIIATAVEAACELGQYAMSYGRVELLLREANREIFGPRGLKVQIAKLKAVAKLAGIPILNDEGKLLSSKASKEKEDDDGNPIASVAGTKILAPLEDIHEIHSLSAQHRRLRALAPWIMPLTFDNLPDENTVAQAGDFEEAEEANEESGKAKGKGKPKGISAMGKMHQYVSDYQRKEGEKKLIKDRKKALDRLTENRQKARDRRDEKLQELEEEETRLREKLEKKRNPDSGYSQEDLEELEKRIEKIQNKKAVKVPEEYEKQMEKVQKKYEEGDKEEKGIREVHFLIVTDKDVIEEQTEDVEVDAEKVGELAEEGKIKTPADKA